MTPEDIQERLNLCRPGHPEDLEDPLIAEALEAAREDPALETWFERQAQFDARIAASLASITAPEGLRESILAQAGGASGERDEGRPATARTTEKRFWQRPWLAAAASIAVLILIVFASRTDTQTAGDAPAIAEAGIPDVVRFLGDKIATFEGDFEKRGTSVEPLKAHLRTRGAAAPASLPRHLKQTASVGCVTFDYGGTKLGMICFKGDQVYHLVCGDASKLGLPLGSSPRVYETAGLSLQVWREGDTIHFLVVKGPKEALPQLT